MKLPKIRRDRITSRLKYLSQFFATIGPMSGAFLLFCVIRLLMYQARPIQFSKEQGVGVFKLIWNFARLVAEEETKSLELRGFFTNFDGEQRFGCKRGMTIYLLDYLLINSDSYTSLKLIRRKYLETQINAIESKKSKSQADLTALGKLKKELEPIAEFLTQAKQQRDAILAEIGILWNVYY